jgi:hypothetical protein
VVEVLEDMLQEVLELVGLVVLEVCVLAQSLLLQGYLLL